MSAEDDTIISTKQIVIEEETATTEEMNEEELEDEKDPEYTNMLQDIFQDELIDSLFQEFSSYIQREALPICAFLNRDGIEKIIDSLSTFK